MHIFHTCQCKQKGTFTSGKTWRKETVTILSQSLKLVEALRFGTSSLRTKSEMRWESLSAPSCGCSSYFHHLISPVVWQAAEDLHPLNPLKFPLVNSHWSQGFFTRLQWPTRTEISRFFPLGTRQDLLPQLLFFTKQLQDLNTVMENQQNLVEVHRGPLGSCCISFMSDICEHLWTFVNCAFSNLWRILVHEGSISRCF